MPRANAMVPPDAIRIEDEVWQEAFSRREPARPNRRRLEAIDGGRAARVTDHPAPSARQRAPLSSPPARPSAPARSSAPARPSAPGRRSAPPAPSATAPVPAVPRPQPAVGELPATSTASPPARRTVKIQGRGAERNLPVPNPSRRRSNRRPYERAGFRPDRVAMWAVVLGFVLILVAVSSGHG